MPGSPYRRLYLSVGLFLIILSVLFFVFTAAILDSGSVKPGVVSAFIGFSLLLGGLYVLRLLALLELSKQP